MNIIRGRVFRTVGLIALIFSLSAVASASYTTVNFNYQNWGKYYTVPYLGESYFAGYAGGLISSEITSGDIFTFNVTSNSGQMHTILKNENISRSINVGELSSLEEGYQFKVKDIDITGGNILLLSLLKNGNEVDTTAIQAGRTYVYSKSIGNIIYGLPIIAIHINSINIPTKSVTIDGIFQISEGFIKVTTTNGSSSYVTVTPVISTPFRTPTPAPMRGSISVSSSPSGASIYLDGAYQGETPKTIYDISIGTHYLEIKLEGYKSWSDSVEVRAGSTSYISIQLAIITPTPVATTPTSTITSIVVTPSPQTTTPTPSKESQLEQEVKELREQTKQESRISWLESAINSILDWLKSII